MKKRIVSLILAAVLVLSLVPAAMAETVISTRPGKEFSAIGISSVDDWNEFARQINEGEATYYALVVFLTQDIGSSKEPVTQIVGNKEYQFCGSFDGCGHTIYAEINEPERDDVALFSYSEGGNAHFSNLTVKGSVTGRKNVGSMIANGAVSEYVSFCHNYADVTGTEGVGGLCGAVVTNFVGCSNHGTIRGEKYVGGLAGDAYDVAFNSCWNEGTVIASDDYAGGLCGNRASVQNCYNAGTVCVESGNAGTHSDSFFVDSGERIDMDSDDPEPEKPVNSYDLAEEKEKHTVPEVLLNQLNQQISEPEDAMQRIEQAAKSFEAYRSTTQTFDFEDEAYQSFQATLFDLRNIHCYMMWEIREGENDGYPVFQPLPELELSGRGTKKDPYRIYTVEDLEQFADMVNGVGWPYFTSEHFCGKYFKLMNDLGTEDDPVLTTIGIQGGADVRYYYPAITEANAVLRCFSGHFDGGGHTVTIEQKHYDPEKLTSDELMALLKKYDNSVERLLPVLSGNKATGLFSSVNGGSGSEVQNLTAAGTVDVSHSEFAAAICGFIYHASIQNCRNTAKFICSEPDSFGDLTIIGGVFAEITGNRAINCVNDANIGENFPKECTNENNPSIGGVGGHATVATVYGCVNNGDIKLNQGEYSSRIGGVIGNSDGASLTNCFNYGDVSAPIDHELRSVVGGVSGGYCAFLSNCGNTGNISAQGAFALGGIGALIALPDGASYLDSTHGAFNCFNTGDLSGAYMTGGILGAAGGTYGYVPYDFSCNVDRFVNIENCYSTGKIVPHTLTQEEIDHGKKSSGGGIVAYILNPVVYEHHGQTFEDGTELELTVIKNCFYDKDTVGLNEDKLADSDLDGVQALSDENCKNGKLCGMLNKYCQENSEEKSFITIQNPGGGRLENANQLYVESTLNSWEQASEEAGGYPGLLPELEEQKLIVYGGGGEPKKAEEETEAEDEVCPRNADCPISRFTDATPLAWYHDGVHFCVENGIMTGTSAVTFAPGAPATRQQIWMVLARISGEKPENMEQARAWAMQTGVSDGKEPAAPITREQLATMLYRFSGSPAAEGELTAADRMWVHPYALNAMLWATQTGLVAGFEDGTLRPTESTTRAQLATILQRYLTMSEE